MITGSNGQLGSDCYAVLGETHHVLALARDELDITDFSNVEARIKKYSPDIIINCAAYTKVDRCETEKETAWKVNVTGAENLARCVNKRGGRLIHISTDYVFDGKKNVPEPYVEEDLPNPVSYYGITKLEGEKRIQRTTDQYAIVRTAWMYGINGHNFLKAILKPALNHPDGKIKVVNDQFGSPTWSYRLARQIVRLIETHSRGIYHATAEGCCTWYELADYFFDKMNLPNRVVPCSSEEYPTPAARPVNSILKNRKLEENKINIMASWQSDLDAFVSRFRGDLIKEVCPKG